MRKHDPQMKTTLGGSMEASHRRQRRRRRLPTASNQMQSRASQPLRYTPPAKGGGNIISKILHAPANAYRWNAKIDAKRNREMEASSRAFQARRRKKK